MTIPVTTSIYGREILDFSILSKIFQAGNFVFDVIKPSIELEVNEL